MQEAKKEQGVNIKANVKLNDSIFNVRGTDADMVKLNYELQLLLNEFLEEVDTASPAALNRYMEGELHRQAAVGGLVGAGSINNADYNYIVHIAVDKVVVSNEVIAVTDNENLEHCQNCGARLNPIVLRKSKAGVELLSSCNQCSRKWVYEVEVKTIRQSTGFEAV